MRHFDEIYAIAADRQGGADAMEADLPQPLTASALKKTPDHRFLAQATKSIFQAGFNWKVVESMWPGFEAAFNGFDIAKCAMLNDEDIDRLARDTRIVRYGAKIRSVQENALFFQTLAAEGGSAAAVIADWPSTDYISLIAMLKKRGARLGGNTGQYFLRQMGKDSFILSRDVIARLIAEGVIDKPPTSKSAMAAVQNAFNTWMDQSGRGLSQISRVLAMSL